MLGLNDGQETLESDPVTKKDRAHELLDDLIDLFRQDGFQTELLEAWNSEETPTARHMKVKELKLRCARPILEKHGFGSFVEVSQFIDKEMLGGYAPDKELALYVKDPDRPRIREEAGTESDGTNWPDPFLAWKFTRIAVICNPDLHFKFPKPDQPTEQLAEEFAEMRSKRQLEQELGRQRARETETFGTRWVVVGGSESNGGLLVRRSQDVDELRSQAEGCLAPGTVIEELESWNERIRYRKVPGTGGGPDVGWVSKVENNKVTLERQA